VAEVAAAVKTVEVLVLVVLAVQEAVVMAETKHPPNPQVQTEQRTEVVAVVAAQIVLIKEATEVRAL
jgi:hypothetical protein